VIGWEARPRRFREIQENDYRGIADRGVVAGEGQAAGLWIHAEDGHVVGALVAGIEEQPGGGCGVIPRVAPAGGGLTGTMAALD